MQPQPLQDARVLITGGGRGIGAAAARLFAAQGANVMIASRTLDQLEQVAESANSALGQQHIFTHAADISQPDDVEALFLQVKQRMGRLDVLVNNAGAICLEAFEQMPLDRWEQMMNINLRGPFLCGQAAFALMKENHNGGSIINISSLAGIRGAEKFAGTSAYVSSKMALIGLTEVMSVEGKPYGIRVNAIAPGAVDTQMLRDALPHLQTQTRPEDIAPSILYLADPKQSGPVTGTVLEIHCNA